MIHDHIHTIEDQLAFSGAQYTQTKSDKASKDVMNLGDQLQYAQAELKRLSDQRYAHMHAHSSLQYVCFRSEMCMQAVSGV